MLKSAGDMEPCIRPHAVVVPVPAQGHINAIMHFAQALAARGFLITFLHTHQIYSRIFTHPPPDLPNFRFRVMTDPFSGDRRFTADDIGEIFDALQKHGPAVEKALRLIIEEGPPITCVISDSYMACTYEATTNLNLPRVLFWPYCAAASVAQANTQFLISQGHIPVKAADLKKPTKLITCLSGVPPLVPKDLRSFYRQEFSSTLLFRACIYDSKMQNKADWVFVNTFEELEGVETIQALSKGFPAQAIGPVFLLQEENHYIFPKEIMKTSLWEEEEEVCMSWLEGHLPRSVLYVSFGSLSPMSNEQIQELSLGLEAGGCPFLWVIRPGLVDGDLSVLPEGYLDRLRGRGLFVKWAPQLRVLRHPSVGGFLTHNGWNSTVESIGTGVPMIGWPCWSEQFLNCRFAKDVWKVGLDLEGKADEKGFVKAVEIERAIKAVMEGEEGREARKNAARLKEAAGTAVQPGGSSYRNIEAFVDHVRNVWLERSGGLAST